MAVLFTSANRNTQVTEDHAELLAAIDALSGRQSGFRRPNQARDDQTMYASGEDSLARLNQVGKAQEVSVQQFFDNMTQYQALQDAARILRYRRCETEGVRAGVGRDRQGPDGALRPRAVAVRRQVPDVPVLSRPRACRDDGITAAIERDDLRHRSARACIASGPRARGVSRHRQASATTRRPVDTRWNNPIRQAQDGLTIMADATGGFAVTDTDDYTSGLHRIIEDLDHYTAGLLSERSGPDDGLPGRPRESCRIGQQDRPLAVKLRDHPDWIVRFSARGTGVAARRRLR